MSLLGDIRSFIRRWIRNPVLVAVVAYLIYKILNKYIRKESFNSNKKFIENIQVLDRKGNEEVIFDTDTNMYAHIIGDDLVETSKTRINI